MRSVIVTFVASCFWGSDSVPFAKNVNLWTGIALAQRCGGLTLPVQLLCDGFAVGLIELLVRLNSM
ncbi:MAG TPA: hypothetical protein VNS63_02735 [Blastocatellia bacterium]|nr:hypothetical protein [Blastocatellia bacterium]